MRVAIYHDYLNQYGGGERVLEAVKEIFPSAKVFTLFYDKKLLPQFKDWDIQVSLAQNLPFIFQKHQIYFWFYPFLVKSFNFKDYDLVISCTHAWGNGVRKKKAKLLVYCHTPIRYFWDLYHDYQKNHWIPFYARWGMPIFKWLIQSWDKRNAKKADQFFSNSEEVAGRIKRNYEREAKVIYPPVNVSFFGKHLFLPKDNYFLVVSRLKAYKRIDLIIHAFNQMNLPLVVVGEGEEEARLKDMAGATIHFEKNITDEKLRETYQKAKGFVYMAHEDFGITMAEAQAAGLPVLAFHKGGASEIVRPGETGILFKEQTVESLIDGMVAFEQHEWNPDLIQENAKRFDTASFKEAILAQIQALKPPSKAISP